MTTPAWQISVGGAAVGGSLNDRLLELTLTLHDGHENDELEIKVDDRDFAVADPNTGDTISISLGYRETGLVFMGTYIVDEVEVEGPPKSMVIRAKAADQGKAQKQHRTKKYQKKKLKDIAGEVANRHGLKLFVSDEVGNVGYPYLHQSEESDWHFLTRLSRDHDALFSIKNGTLLFVKRGDSASASGLSMPQVQVAEWGLVKYRATKKDRPKHDKAKGHWHDRKKSKHKIEDSTESGDGKATFTLRHPHQNKDLAQRAANAKINELKRAEGSIEISIIGDPSVQPEGTLSVSTGRSVLDGTWLIKTVTHKWTNSGAETSISGERPKDGGGGSK
jgi:phage protein D